MNDERRKGKKMCAVSSDYRPRSMGVLCQEALEILRHPDHTSFLSCNQIGEMLFRDATYRGSAPYALIAGKVLKRLAAAGLAKISGRSFAGQWYTGWEITDAGRRCDYQSRNNER